MSYQKLLKIDKSFFSKEDVAYALGIEPESAAVLCSRYAKKGLLTRLKRGLYARTETLSNLGQMELFRLANLLQVPSYISLTTALSYQGITTQVQRNVFESISIKRTKTFLRGPFTFRYVKISPRLYFGFKREGDAFVASAEKATLDSFYLASMGRYPLDVSALDLTKLDGQAVTKLSGSFPQKTIKYFEKNYEKAARSRKL
jgi:predicted transcriptional regulator of viral defense system